jgi:virulence factor Mce-like protein
MVAMAFFTLSCFGLLLFLWLAFGGPIPLKPEGYRFSATIPEAATLAVEADVRMAGVNVGKVKSKELQSGAARTLIEVELREPYAPIAKDARAILRQKTLLGETYVEISPGHRAAGMLPDGGRLRSANVEPTVELDEIFNAFDEPTRHAFQEWLAELTEAVAGGRSQDLNDAIGNLEGFAGDGAKLLETLDEQEVAVRRLVKNTGVVFGALNERDGALRELIVNSGNTFEATASKDEALAETFHIFPTFLDESKATLARLEDFSRDAHPLVNDLKGPADDLGPTVRDLGDLAPDLEALFRDLDPLINASEDGLPALERVVDGTEPLLESLHIVLPELNPVLSYLSFNQAVIAGFITNGSSNLIRGTSPTTPWSTQQPLNDDRSFQRWATRPAFDRGNAYVAPNAYVRAYPLGTLEDITCPGGQEIPDAVDTGLPGGTEAAPPCFIVPPSLFQHQQFPKLVKGGAPIVRAPQGREGTEPATP